MQESLATIWPKIESFPIDEGRPALPFAARLARENGWSQGYAERVIFEYRRFLCLMVAAEHPVGPSDAVDQAWHLHLTYTRSYWDRLCGEVVKRPLHHNPTRGGGEEDDKHRTLYAKTLAAYEAFFGEAPPEDIWPEVDVRFSPVMQFRRVNVRRNWILSRGSRSSRPVAGTVLGVGLAATLLVMINGPVGGPLGARHMGLSSLTINLLMLGIGLAVAMGIVVIHLWRRRCPECGKSLALTRTSKTKSESGRRMVQWRCSQCAHRIWRRGSPPRSRSDSGAGGGFDGFFGGCLGGGGCGGGCGGGGCGGGGG